MSLPNRGRLRYTFALDSSSLWDAFVIARIALDYRGRTLPLSWIVLKQQSTMVASEKYKHMLKNAASIPPSGFGTLSNANGFEEFGDPGWGGGPEG